MTVEFGRAVRPVSAGQPIPISDYSRHGSDPSFRHRQVDGSHSRALLAMSGIVSTPLLPWGWVGGRTIRPPRRTEISRCATSCAHPPQPHLVHPLVAGEHRSSRARALRAQRLAGAVNGAGNGLEHAAVIAAQVGSPFDRHSDMEHGPGSHVKGRDARPGGMPLPSRGAQFLPHSGSGSGWLSHSLWLASCSFSMRSISAWYRPWRRLYCTTKLVS